MPPPTAIPHPAYTPRRSILNLRRGSLLRGNIFIFGSLAAALLLSDFPNNRPSLFLIIPSLFAIWGTIDTIRCMQRTWNFYHAGVILCIYMDLMVLAMILFFLVYPFMSSGSSTS